MPRPIRPWFRFYTESFGDRKMLRLTPLQRWLWVAILGAARESPTPGELLIAEGEPMTMDELARYADVRTKDVLSALPIMVRLGMIQQTEDSIVVVNWGARQYESDNVTARTRDHRERSREQDRNVPKNVRRNTPETETEEEIKDSSSEIADAIPDKEPKRDDVTRICQHLQAKIVENGSKRPNITQAWRREARLLLDRDGKTEQQIIAAIDWCQADSFWKTNILSMPTLREKYDRIRLRAQEEREKALRVPDLRVAPVPFTPEPPPAEIADDPEACDRWYRDQQARRSA